MVGAQLASRLIDGTLALLHLPRTDFVILSLNEIGGYLLAAASFFALGGRSRPARISASHWCWRRWANGCAATSKCGRFGFAAAASAYMTGHLANFAWISLRFHEVSPGVIRVPLAYPQAAMAIGALILTIALVDELFIVVSRGRPSFRAAEDAITLGKEG